MGLAADISIRGCRKIETAAKVNNGLEDHFIG
jgi:hypothetical protein